MSYPPVRYLVIALILAAGVNRDAHSGEEPSFYNDFAVENGLIAPNEIDHGGPGRDGIPALDAPRFLAGTDRTGTIDNGDRVLGLYYNGVAKAYPVSILEQHIVVNDQFGQTPILITFCPLCGSGMAFLAKVEDQTLAFGVSGLIYNSNMLLYDRNTGSLWSQIMMKAVTGPMTGTKLLQLPARYTSWQNWLTEHPDSLLLSRETGFERDYDNGPYEDYKRLPSVTFATLNQDMRLASKDRVVGVTAGGESMALPFTALDKLDKPLQINVGSTEFNVQWDSDAQAAKVFDANGNEGNRPVITP